MSAALTQAERLSPDGFMAFLEPRPDHERWELFDGVAVMQASPTFVHALVLRNIDQLINHALQASGSDWVGLQNTMADLNEVVPGNMFVPDLMVVDSTIIEPLMNFTSECIMAVEVISRSDRRRVGRGLDRKIEVKTERYRALPRCEAVLIAEQDRMDATLHLRGPDGWSERHMIDPDEEIAIPLVGLVCRLRDFYLRTSLVRRPG